MVSCGYSTCFAVRTCDGLCHLIFSMDHVGIPFGFQPIIWTFVRHGLCFGCCFSGPLPLRSLINGPPIGVRVRESLIITLHSEIDHLHLSIEAQCVTTLLPLGDCHTLLAETKLLILLFLRQKLLFRCSFYKGFTSIRAIRFKI